MSVNAVVPMSRISLSLGEWEKSGPLGGIASAIANAIMMPLQARACVPLESHAFPNWDTGACYLLSPQNWARSESWRLRSPWPELPPLVNTLPKVEAVGFRPMLFVPLQPLPLHQFG